MRNENISCQSDDLTSEEIEKMGKHGITRLPVYYYQAGQYRYANLRDAIAQAKREALRTGTHE